MCECMFECIAYVCAYVYCSPVLPFPCPIIHSYITHNAFVLTTGNVMTFSRVYIWLYCTHIKKAILYLYINIIFASLNRVRTEGLNDGLERLVDLNTPMQSMMRKGLYLER